MRILSWNIQSGLGCDGRRDIKRIIERIVDRPELPDVLCFQEVARYIPECCTDAQQDQYRIITAMLPDYDVVWGPGMRWFQGKKPPQEFGNLTMARIPILDSRVHCLPMPAATGNMQMPRSCVETVIAIGGKNIRVMNTHLAFHIADERRLQIDYICNWQRWREQNNINPPRAGYGSYAAQYLEEDCILCGDLNFTPVDKEYAMLRQAGWTDAWQVSKYQGERLPTCGVHDRELWPQGPHCRDYFWLSSSLRHCDTRINIDVECNYSDHQPITLQLQSVRDNG